MRQIKYRDLDSHFTESKESLFLSEPRIPRKLKKKIKVWCGIHWGGLDNGQKLWYYMEQSNPNYKKFLIKKICER